MKNWIKIVIVLGVSLLFVLLAYIIGNKMVNGRHSFDAIITRINNTIFVVKGLEENDVNHRGEFSFSIENVKVVKDNKKVEYETLKIGDEVTVRYIGGVNETYPAQIKADKIVIKTHMN